MREEASSLVAYHSRPAPTERLDKCFSFFLSHLSERQFMSTKIKRKIVAAIILIVIQNELSKWINQDK